MGFQILNESNEPIKINTLDEEIAKFWNVEVEKRHYASPVIIPEGLSLSEQFEYVSKQTTRNWFDTIGRIISDNRFNERNWDDIKNSLVCTNLFFFSYHEKPEVQAEFVKYIREDFKPHLDLIDYFKSKNYTFKSV